jgi:hypothetical protein
VYVKEDKPKNIAEPERSINKPNVNPDKIPVNLPCFTDK